MDNTILKLDNTFSIESAKETQKKANKSRKLFLNSLPLEDRKKFKAVEKASTALINAGVDFYLFPLLPAKTNIDKVSCWQWNSLPASIKMDENNKPTKESVELAMRLNESLVANVYALNSHLLKEGGFKEKMESWADFTHFCLSREQEYLNPTVAGAIIKDGV